MYRGLVWLVASCVLLAAGAYTWSQRQRVVQSVAAPAVFPPSDEASPVYEEEKQAAQMVTLTGPLADHMTHQGAGQTGILPASAYAAGSEATSNSKTPYKPSANDRVGDSPVGTSTPILRKTFPVVAVVNLPFDIPPHAANPHLKGAYRSFVKSNGGEAAADVEFMLMNQQQFTALLSGHLGDAVFSADDAHNQEVNFTMPPTFSDPVRYYLVFRNNSRERGKKLVQADFRVDF